MATKKNALDWTLAPAPESTDHVKINAQYELFINGKWVKPKSGKYFDTINPANEQKIARIAEANEADVDAAVKAARKAYDTCVEQDARGRTRQVHLPHRAAAAGEGPRVRRHRKHGRRQGHPRKPRRGRAPRRRALLLLRRLGRQA
jgi:hypothetical protein